MMPRGGKKAHWKQIGAFDSVCDWPGRYNNAGDFTGKLNVRDLP
jgi:hypothetical protein